MHARSCPRGRYVLPDYGFPFEVQPETDRCLRQHGLEVRVVGLDIMNDSERSYYLSYISVMNAAIAQKFGPDVFERCCRYKPISEPCVGRSMSEMGTLLQLRSLDSLKEYSDAPCVQQEQQTNTEYKLGSKHYTVGSFKKHGRV